MQYMSVNHVSLAYQEASNESSSIPCCSMGLKRRVRGKGTLAVGDMAQKKKLSVAFWWNNRQVKSNNVSLCRPCTVYHKLRESESSTCHKSWKGPVDPASDEDHGKHVRNVSLHHVCQHAGICVKMQRETRQKSYKISANTRALGTVVSVATDWFVHLTLQFYLLYSIFSFAKG